MSIQKSSVEQQGKRGRGRPRIHPPRPPVESPGKPGRKATGRSQRAVLLPLGLIEAAREEQARRAPERASIGGIIAEWADAGRSAMG